MKQFIRYLYEYEQGKRTRNVGFVKVEEKGDLCTIHIHGKGFHRAKDMAMELYLFRIEEGRCIGLLQGAMEPMDLSIHYRLAYSKEDVGGREIYDQIQGMILCAGGHRRYAAVWDDMPVDVEHMEVDGEATKQGEMPQEEQAQETTPQEEQVKEEEGKEMPISEGPKEEAQVETQSTGCTSVHYRKIDRKELAELPRCEWKLANNSFLLHGYHNYQHLLLIEDEGILFVGVPGIYHEKEREAARAFGFFQFHRVEESVLGLESKERNDMDDFGYWCRQVQKKPL